MGGVAAGTMWAWAKGHCELEGNKAADAGASVGKTGKTNAVAVGPVLRDHNQIRQQWRQRWKHHTEHDSVVPSVVSHGGGAGRV